MDNLYARAVFFVSDAGASQRYYVDRLGFTEDWTHRQEDRVWVCQVSLFGFELILNQIDDVTKPRAGHGRVFIGLEDGQIEPVLQHIETHHIPVDRRDWGRPTLVIHDLDGNEVFLWEPDQQPQGTPGSLP